MHVPHLVLVMLASLTWAGFAVMMKAFFRCADQKTPAKTCLIFSAYICSLMELAVVILCRSRSELGGWVGVGCFGLANLIFWWSLSSHGKKHPAFAFIPTAPVSLTKTGPYRLIRHPIYSAYLLTWLAGPIATGQLWLLLPIAWMGLLYYRAAWQEEQFFSSSAFALEYAAYQKQTGMFFPRVLGWGCCLKAE